MLLANDNEVKQLKKPELKNNKNILPITADSSQQKSEILNEDINQYNNPIMVPHNNILLEKVTISVDQHKENVAGEDEPLLQTSSVSKGCCNGYCIIL